LIGAIASDKGNCPDLVARVQLPPAPARVREIESMTVL
jgi:hypothetical protein